MKFVIINFIKNLFISEGEKPTKVITQTQKEIQDMPILDTFEEIIDKVIEHEGGYVNDPDDPGGETKYGIAKKSNPDVDIANLTIEEAKKIYYGEADPRPIRGETTKEQAEELLDEGVPIAKLPWSSREDA